VRATAVANRRPEGAGARREAEIVTGAAGRR